MIYKTIVVGFSILLGSMSGVAAEDLLPPNECALQVASRSTLSQVRNVVADIDDRRYLQVFKASNGWYAVSIGTLKPHEVDPVLAKWKRSGKIPSDSLCTYGKNYLYEVNWKTGDRISSTTSPIKNSSPSVVNKKINCGAIDLKKEIAACYAVTLGSKGCTQYISENRVAAADTYSERVALGAACTAGINSSFAKETTPSDLIFVAVDEFLDTSCEQIQSENVLAQLFVGLPTCVANLARWEGKINQAKRCEREIIHQCGRP